MLFLLKLNFKKKFFSDGLTDCVDPDCCQQSNCYISPLCQGSPDPLDLIQQSQPLFSQHTSRLFYDRIKFLIGKDSTHVIPPEISFDSRYICIYFILNKQWLCFFLNCERKIPSKDQATFHSTQYISISFLGFSGMPKTLTISYEREVIS